MTRDGMTGVSIEYNILNLPSKIFDGSGNIRYIYDANGVKLASHVGSSSTYYRSVMTYARNGGGAEQLLQIGTQGGMIAREGSSYVYKYLKTDHLGSTRVVLAARSGQLQEEQRTDYYPYGLSHSLSNLHLNKFLFSGKEIQDANIGSTGMLGLYDFHARYYNPFLGRWFNIDPALQFTNPYIYCGNSPQMYIDPDGEWIHIAIGAFIGGMINMAMHHEVGRFTWNDLKYFGIGAIAGAAGAWAGGAAGGLVKLNSFGSFVANGAVSGATGGFAGGFAGGAGNAWAGGSNFGQGLMTGLAEGGMGFASGALGGALSGMFSYATLNSSLAITDPGMVNSDGSLVPSNETLRKFSDENFSTVKYRNRAELLYDNAKVTPGASATTNPRPVNGKYQVYFSDNSFRSKMQLFMDMGHEYVHVSQLVNNCSSTTALMEVGAYNWNIKTLKGAGYSAENYQQYYDFYNKEVIRQGLKGYAPSYLNVDYFKKWGIPTTIPDHILK